MNAARDAKSESDLEEVHSELLNLLTAAVADLDSDKLSEQSFDSFRTILEIGLEAVRDRRDVLRVAAGKDMHPAAFVSATARSSAAHGVPAASPIVTSHPPQVFPSGSGL
jgi:hypothetical protein